MSCSLPHPSQAKESVGITKPFIGIDGVLALLIGMTLGTAGKTETDWILEPDVDFPAPVMTGIAENHAGFHWFHVQNEVSES